MKTRLSIFISALLLLPLIGIYLSGSNWSTFFNNTASIDTNMSGILFTSLTLLGCSLLFNHLVHRFTSNNPLSAQRNYFLSMAAASAILGWLLAYLNLFTHNWMPQQQHNMLIQLLLYTPLFALLAPTILLTRSLLSTLPGILKLLKLNIAIPATNNEITIFTLIPLILIGLVGGAIWPIELFWLIWLAPLLLLLSLQLLWNEDTIFTNLKNGDWSRIICTVLAGIIVGNLAVVAYQNQGGSLAIHLPHPLLAQLGYGILGLICLQLGDIIANAWHGKRRSDLYPQKGKFPIPIVVKKD
jgi:hypothetical protein